jgi:hypothetical protein
MKKVKAICKTCRFALTAGEAGVGDTCPWCKRGVLEAPEEGVWVMSEHEDNEPIGEYQDKNGKEIEECPEIENQD